ncbi:Protein of unknown function [Devosia sp. YR412]|uniref:DUF2934 domain-containing protein n=1 Tax=Devosia sp. YR412 TaxID=1881030 RepID=UPI0008CED5F2|nr:DUF2934 domain-containing protein [Devosia sp. YR412]SEQ60336.1 Protein of unknown function [Devosia sp. YR412]
MEDQVRRRAYEMWEQDGCPAGLDQQYWFKALAEIAAAGVAEIRPARKRVAKVKKAA